MRLKKIKLAGFKSFVDPTTLELPSDLVGVIGPNGCGKSNVIDAVRWVLGESSAKNLRGESMNDVIFNGSSNRKPVGQASIELVFDNSEGTLTGEWASYIEISVKRVATRDGQSTYFLNGARCRRRDITELFLGTGLGPRSYAIIEQGMISKLIEARPEDLRAFLEEAAGISLYKKRRQETETRIAHTRENLDRISDVRQELEKQLERLKRQSEAALKFKEYKVEQNKLEAELLTLRWQVLNEQSAKKSLDIKRLMTSIEEKQANKLSVDKALDIGRVEYNQAMEALNAQQSGYYDLGARIARVEQTLEHYRERQAQLQADLEQVIIQCAQVDAQIQIDQDHSKEIAEKASVLETSLDSLQASNVKEEQAVQLAEETLQAWVQGFEVFSQDALQPIKTTEVEKARIEQLERHSQEVHRRLNRLNEELSSLNIEPLALECEALSATLAKQEQEHHTNAERFQDLNTHIQQLRTTLSEHNRTFNDFKNQQQVLKGREASLITLQQAALGKTDRGVIQWLKAAGIEEAPRLGEGLIVEQGYEEAVETVLGKAVEAVCVSELGSMMQILDELSIGQLMILDVGSERVSLSMDTQSSETPKLMSKIKISPQMNSILSLLHGVYVVDDLQTALALRAQLSPSESVITKAGIWLGAQWIKVYRGEEGHTGVLAREAELKSVTEALEALNTQLLDCQSLRDASEVQLRALETEQEKMRQTQQEATKQIQKLSSELSAKQVRLENSKNRIQRIQEDTSLCQQQLDSGKEEVNAARLVLQTALDAMADNTLQKETLLKERDALKTVLHEATVRAKKARDEFHAHTVHIQTLKAQLQATSEGMKRLMQQRSDLLARQTSLQTECDQKGTVETDKEQLETLLAQRLSVEQNLNAARSVLDTIEQNLRLKEKDRNAIEQASEALRTQLDTVKMDWQALEVRSETVQEKLSECGVSAEQVLETLSKEATEAVWEKDLEQVTARIQRLGAINLAAIEEYQIEGERKTYLDTQYQDLTEALETLENAIRKMDKETRLTFKETFEKVNAQFQELFPKLFGGGQASLELVGEDLLEAGITVMARPPGKKNSTIHLLSGGEKALTAVALVFAIFHLNPAPFCMLDEVDAPLDDANVGRFCRLVQHMAQKIQFIIITHNKLAMEIAHHLIGVTMKEPGVSRLVSVDIEQAVALIDN